MKILSDILLIIGTVVMCYGVSMFCLPAAVVLAGLFIVYCSFTIHKAGK